MIQECQSCGSEADPLTHCTECGEFVALDVHIESSAAAPDTPILPGVAAASGPHESSAAQELPAVSSASRQRESASSDAGTVGRSDSGHTKAGNNAVRDSAQHPVAASGPRSLGQDVNYQLELNHELVKALDRLANVAKQLGADLDEGGALAQAAAVLKKCGARS